MFFKDNFLIINYFHINLLYKAESMENLQEEIKLRQSNSPKLTLSKSEQQRWSLF